MSSSATNSPTKSGSYWTPRSPQQAKMANALKETQPSADVVGDAVNKKKKLGKRISQSFKKLVTPRGSLRASTEELPSYSTLSALDEASSNLSTSTDDYTIAAAHPTATEASVVMQQEPSVSAVTVGDEIGAVDVAPVLQPTTSAGALLPPRAPSQARMARPASSASNNNAAGSLVEGSSPSLSRPTLSRPSMSGPSPSAGSFSQRPNLSRPSLSRPSMTGRPNLGRPSLSRPSISSSASRAAESAAGAAAEGPAAAVEAEVQQQVQEQPAAAAPAAAAAEEVVAPASEVAVTAAPEPAAPEVEAPAAAQQSAAVVAAPQPRRAVRFLGALLRLTIMVGAVMGAAALSGHPIDVPKKWDEVRKKLAGGSK